MKTLHPKIFGGILCRRGLEQDIQQIEKWHEIPEIDLVIADLYPFEATVASGADEAAIIEKIDRWNLVDSCCCKNYNDVVIVASQAQYKPLLDMLMEHGANSSLEERRWMAKKKLLPYLHIMIRLFSTTLMPKKVRLSVNLPMIRKCFAMVRIPSKGFLWKFGSNVRSNSWKRNFI